jgi:phytoene dehydrogenase-like protein
MIDLVNDFAPNFKTSVLGPQINTPLDLERNFGLIGGDIFHGCLSMDQSFSARPMLGHADYRGPLKALYMCGAGNHRRFSTAAFELSRNLKDDARRVQNSRSQAIAPLISTLTVDCGA